jgi:hypothetical protein
MMAARPPRFATWLLERFIGGPRRDSLVGDLLEQYPQRRSTAWYWRQVVTAIVVSAARDISAHKKLAVRAVAIGWLGYALLSFPAHWLAEIVNLRVQDWLVTSGRYSFWPVFLSGPLSATLFACIAGAVIGWLVARLHPTHAVTMVCLFSVSVLLFELGLTGLLLSTQRHAPMPQAALMLPVVLAMGTPVSVLLGGLWTARPAKDSLSGIAADKGLDLGSE